MSRINVEPIQIIPIPGIYFETNNTIVDEPIKDNSFNYIHTGEYIASSSSNSGVDHIAAKAFNKISDDFWQCDFAKNPDYNKYNVTYPQYTTNPYIKSNSGPSTYKTIGGGSVNTLWTTHMGESANNIIINGEWLQMRIPSKYPMYLFSYSLLTPPPINAITFPKSFVVVGSMDGVKWNYIDQQIIDSSKRTLVSPSRIPQEFNVNCESKYCYFRLIITSLFEKNDIIQINQWALNGLTAAHVNKEAFTDMRPYSSSSDSLSFYKHSTAIEYPNDSPYSGSATSLPIESIRPVVSGSLQNTGDSNYIYFIIPILVTSVLLYRIIR